MPRLLRITTVPISLHLLLQGQFGYMRQHGFDVITMSADGVEVSSVSKDGTKHIIIPFTRKITLLRDLKCLWQLIWEIKRIRPDIVHTHTPKAGLLGMMAAWICNVPVRMHTVAGLPLVEATGLRRKVLEIAERITYSCAHVVYPNSSGLKKFIENHFHVAPSKVKIIGSGSSNGIDTDFFTRSPVLEKQTEQLKQRYKIRPDDVVFSFVGRIVRDKGIVDLVKAFKILNRERVDNGARLFLLLVGHFEDDLDPLPPEILEFLVKDESVVLAGFQADIRPWIMASNIFVFPSYREGFPNVVMQASLLTVPCIVSDINGCNEIVLNNETGIIVPPKDINALSTAMRALASDAAKRKFLAEAARNYVAANFKREVIWEELKNEYYKLMAKATSPNSSAEKKQLRL